MLILWQYLSYIIAVCFTATTIRSPIFTIDNGDDCDDRNELDEDEDVDEDDNNDDDGGVDDNTGLV